MEQSNKKQQSVGKQTYFKIPAKNEKELKSIAAAKSPQLLSQHIQSINTEAQFFFNRKDYESALKKLKQAEILLQYVAESCRNVKKHLIIVILNNLVCISQMLWDLKSASDYLQGIIYNLSLNRQISCQSKLSQSIMMSSILTQQVQSFSQDIKFAQYNLKYCAISSSLLRHNSALIAARKALKIGISSIIRMSKHSIRDLQLFQSELVFNKIITLKSCIEMKQLFNKQNKRQDFLNLVYSFWKKESQKAKQRLVQEYFKSTCLADIMSLTFQGFQSNIQTNICQQSPFYFFLITSVSYFSISNELKSINQVENQKDSSYFYFMSLITYMLLIPYQSPYIQFLINGYTKISGKTVLVCSQKVTFAEINDFMKNEEAGILPQQSVTTPQIHRRKNLRLDQQNQKLKKIIQNNGLAHKKQLMTLRSFDKKIKSLSTSRNQSKKQIENAKHVHMLKSNNISRKEQQLWQQQKKIVKKKQPKLKKHHGNDKYDELGQKYFQMAFKKPRSPQVLLLSKRQTGNSQSSTKDQSCSEKVLKLSKLKKDKILMNSRQLKTKK